MKEQWHLFIQMVGREINQFMNMWLMKSWDMDHSLNKSLRELSGKTLIRREILFWNLKMQNLMKSKLSEDWLCLIMNMLQNELLSNWSQNKFQNKTLSMISQFLKNREFKSNNNKNPKEIQQEELPCKQFDLRNEIFKSFSKARVTGKLIKNFTKRNSLKDHLIYTEQKKRILFKNSSEMK